MPLRSTDDVITGRSITSKFADVDRSVEAVPTLEAAARRFEFDADKVRRLVDLKLKHDRPDADEMETLFEWVYQVIDHLARKADTFGRSGNA